jgi:hypothetical protein
LFKRKLALERDEDPAETEEQIQRSSLFKVGVKLWVHNSDKLLQSAKLSLHTALISEEIRLLTVSQVVVEYSPSFS